jgi:hypothetical protein
MPGPVPGIHVFGAGEQKDVDGRDGPGHDGGEGINLRIVLTAVQDFAYFLRALPINSA